MLRMSRLCWKAVRDVFAFDGSWRDVYVLGTDVAAWQRTLDALRAAGYDLSYFRDHQPVQLPADVTEVFPLPDESSRMLSVRFGGILANCHFFTTEAIRFDVDPREVTGPDQLNALFGFMRCLATAVSKEAVLTDEGCPQGVYFRVPPGSAGIERVD
jgi:hypothetical protein